MNYLQNSLIHKAAGTCDYERAKINRLLKLLNQLSLYETSQIDKNALNSIIQALKSTCENKTINKIILLMKLAYRFNEISFDYLETFPKLKEGKRHFDIIEHLELKKIMNFIAHADESIGNTILYKAIISLMIETGVRANELLNIKVSNINFNDKCILLTTTKSSKNRYVFFTALSESFITKMMQLGPRREILLYNILKKRIALARDVKYMVDKLKKELDITLLHPHMFRHTFATLAHEHGMDLLTLKELLGHENLSTTQIYTHISKDKLRSSYAATFKKIESIKID
jgi:site-specific recombinase XerD